jgi:hypothetical protein
MEGSARRGDGLVAGRLEDNFNSQLQIATRKRDARTDDGDDDDDDDAMTGRAGAVAKGVRDADVRARRVVTTPERARRDTYARLKGSRTTTGRAKKRIRWRR